GEGELQGRERGQESPPGRGLAVGGGAAEDGGHAGRLDPDGGRSPPKKISSRARVPTRSAHAGSSAARTAPARVASAWTQWPGVEWSGTAWAGRITPR